MIRVNDRHLSSIEYENTYGKLNAYLSDKLRRVPGRYAHFLREPFNNLLNDIYIDIMELTNVYVSEKKIQSMERYRKCIDILAKMEQVISFCYTYWNLSGMDNGIKLVTAKQRQYCADFVNKEIHLIAGVMQRCRKDARWEADIPFMYPYSNKDLKEVIFIRKLAELERIIYKRAIQMGKGYRDAGMELLVSLSRDALYHACTGNQICADESEAAAKKRQKEFSACIGNLMSMNRPIRELAFDRIFSEEELEKLCTLNAECQKILKAVKESDRERNAS